MFGTIVESGIMDKIMDIANNYMKRDRDQYSKVNSIISDYCKKHKDRVLVSDMSISCGDTGANLEFKTLQTYSTDPYTDCINIGTELLNIGVWSKVKTNIYELSYTVEYDSRNFIKMDKMEMYKNRPLIELIAPIVENNKSYMPTELEIINIYKQLHDPFHYDKYDNLKKQLTCAHKNYLQRIEDKEFFEEVKISNITEENCKPCKIKGSNIMEGLKKQLYDNYLYINQDKYMPIGLTYVSFLKKSISFDDKLQIVSANDIEYDIEHILDFLSNITNITFIYKKHYLHLPHDTKTTCYTIYAEFAQLNSKKKEKPLIDIYNNGKFELIPYVNMSISGKSIKMPNKYAILRFMCIDVWIYKIVMNTKAILEKTFSIEPAVLRKIIEVLSNIKFVYSYDSSIEQVDDYFGVYDDPEIASKFANATNKAAYPEYIYLREKND
jgi:hypothetical protein